MQNLKRNQAFTMNDMLIVMAILVVIIVLLLPVLVSFRRPTHRHGGMQNSTQVRGIQTGLVLYAQGNNSHYVGVKSDGETIDPLVGLTTQGRVQKLIDDNYFTIEYARSPSEVQTGTTSYAMLKIDTNPDEKNITKSIRNSEWNDTTNTLSVVVSDRAVPVNGSYTRISSIHTKPSPGRSDWRGSVAWNDNHVSFESTSILPTKYGAVDHASDNLFTTPNLTYGDDAFMVWHGTDGL